MSSEQIYQELQKLGIPVAYSVFNDSEEVELPYMIYDLGESIGFHADGVVYVDTAVLTVKLYTRILDRELEKKLKQILRDNGLIYQRSEELVADLSLYEITYTMEVFINE